MKTIFTFSALLLSLNAGAGDDHPAKNKRVPSSDATTNNVTVENVQNSQFDIAERWTDKNGVTCYVVKYSDGHGTSSSISCAKP